MGRLLNVFAALICVLSCGLYGSMFWALHDVARQTSSLTAYGFIISVILTSVNVFLVVKSWRKEETLNSILRSVLCVQIIILLFLNGLFCELFVRINWRILDT